MLPPIFAAIPAGPHLAAIGGAGHQARPALVEHHLEHRVRRWRADIDLCPAVASVLAVQQHAEIALEATARSDADMPRIAGHLADVTAIDLPLGVERLQRHVPPMVAAIVAAEHAGAGNADRSIMPSS